MSKYFIITVDTEGDNLWRWKMGEKITTRNARYLQRFQLLCDKYKFKPVYLTDYEMVRDPFYVEFAKNVLCNRTGEIGLHLHAWNSPPKYKLNVKYNGYPYLIEYPLKVMEEKIKFMIDCLSETFQINIISHRSGRWVTNTAYFDLLRKYGLKIDCSVTPCVNWASTEGASVLGGSDYRYAPKRPYRIAEDVWEVPMTIRKIRHCTRGSLIHRVKTAVQGEVLWMRPAGQTLQDLVHLFNKVKKEPVDYLEFMIHSSELMPDGSPYFPTEALVEKLYSDLEMFFELIYKSCRGVTLREYYEQELND